MAPRKRRRADEPPRVRLGRALGEHMSDDFDAFGAEVIAKLRTDKPVEYMKLMTSILSGAAGKDVDDAPQYSVIERHIISPSEDHDC